MRGGSAGARAWSVALPGARPPRGFDWEVELRAEDGTTWRHGGRARSDARGQRSILVRLPFELPLGIHALRLEIAGADVIRQTLIVAPATCFPLDGVRAVGVLCNLYTVQSRKNLGFGDCGDLRRLAVGAAARGAAFIGVNPLHAIRNTPDERSPYSPISRLFLNPLYLDVAAIPELRLEPALRRRLESPAAARAREASELDYPELAARKDAALRVLHRRFVAAHRDRATPRGRAYARFLAEQGQDLGDFATFVLLDRRFRAAARPIRDWRRWPAPLRDPRSAAVARARDEQPLEFDFHRWLQFELDRQLADAAAAARRHGARLGLFRDLAIGSVGNGCDAWANQELFRAGVSLGAPPDAYSATGQVWNIPPLDPRALRADGFRFFARVLRANMRHAGLLRIDHVIGLVRQFWVPAGRSGVSGAFVPFPAEELFSVLALESRRNRCAVVGEDLGHVPAELPGLMRRFGVLQTKVLVFERTGAGALKGARSYPRNSFASANTHDLAPLRGFASGVDLPLLRRLGVIASDRALVAAARARRRDIASLLQVLRREGALGRDDPPDLDALVRAVHDFLGSTKAALVGISLDDLGGEYLPVNVPGVTSARHPVWSRRMREDLARILASMKLPVRGARTSRRASAGSRRR